MVWKDAFANYWYTLWKLFDCWLYETLDGKIPNKHGRGSRRSDL